ncbi:MAG: bifunctional DNA primase/polymerase [Nitriliruptoraceae bacterium]|nr:bifunctional DNA primase/polymerase [Nitriliruptoraceae bacterium]
MSDHLGPMHDALTYAGGWEWNVLPVRAGAKLPATPHGFHDATTDPDRIIDWWEAVPTYNVGIATGAVSGLVVIDVDPGGEPTMHELVREHGPLPRAVAVHTPRGGMHGYYRHPGIRVPCSAGKLGTGVDVRGDGGYVLAPPSVVNDAPYQWRDQPWPGPPDPPELPPAWIDLLTVPADAPRPARPVAPAVSGVAGRLAAWTTAAVRGELEDVASAATGTRNHTLNRAAFRLGQLTAAGALDPDAALAALDAAASACGLGNGEASRTIASGFGSGLDQPAELPEVAT